MERDLANLYGNSTTYLVGRLGTGLVAAETSSIVEVHSSRNITRVPSARRHIVGLLSRGHEIVPVVDLAIDRPQGFLFKRPRAIVVSLYAGAGYVGLYLDGAEGLIEGGKAHLNWGDRFYLRRLVWYEGCFPRKIDKPIRGLVVPIVDANILNEIVKTVGSSQESGGVR